MRRPRPRRRLEPTPGCGPISSAPAGGSSCTTAVGRRVWPAGEIALSATLSRHPRSLNGTETGQSQVEVSINQQVRRCRQSPRRATARAAHPSRLAALAPQDDGAREAEADYCHSKQPQAFRAFERAERKERAQRAAGGFRPRPIGRRHRLFALPVTRLRHEAAPRAAAARVGAIAPIFQQRALCLREISVPLAVRQNAPLLERHPPRKPPLRRAQFSSHDISHPAPQSGEGGPPCASRAVEGAWAATLLCRSERTEPPHAPSTMLRMVPLPRFAGADKQNRFAARSHSFSPRAGRRSG